MTEQPEPTTAEDIIFEANLKEFANRVAIICGLERGGKIGPLEAYRRIRDLYSSLDRSRHNLYPEREDDEDD